MRRIPLDKHLVEFVVPQQALTHTLQAHPRTPRLGPHNHPHLSLISFFQAFVILVPRSSGFNYLALASCADYLVNGFVPSDFFCVLALYRILDEELIQS